MPWSSVLAAKLVVDSAYKLTICKILKGSKSNLFGDNDENSLRKNKPNIANIQLDKRYIVRKLQLPFIMFTTTGKRPILMTSLVLIALAISISSTSEYLSISVARNVELLLTDDSIMVPTASATSGGVDDEGNGNGNDNENSNGGDPAEPTESTTAQRHFIRSVSTPMPPPAPSPTSTQLPTTALTVSPTLTPTPLQPPPPIIITNVNNVNINDEQTFEGAIRATPECAYVAANITLGPSRMEGGGARILAAVEPCIITDGTVLVNLPDKQGIQLVAANIQGGRTTQSAIIPLQRIAPVTQGQVLFGADLNEQVTGPDQARGESATLNGNINALFLWNNSGQAVEFVRDHSVALDTFLRR
jgi:hypothetical protein